MAARYLVDSRAMTREDSGYSPCELREAGSESRSIIVCIEIPTATRSATSARGRSSGAGSGERARPPSASTRNR